MSEKGLTSDRRERIRLIAQLDIEHRFQLTQTEISNLVEEQGYPASQPQICEDKKNPFYHQCLTEYKRGYIRILQIEATEVVDSAIKAAHDFKDKIEATIDEIRMHVDSKNFKTALGLIRELNSIYFAGLDTSKWFLEKTDPDYAIRLKAEVEHFNAPADHDDPELESLIEEINAVPIQFDNLQLPSNGNGNGNGGGNGNGNGSRPDSGDI